ncbi:hypothetical protein C8Q75DRAFT_227853 [Abortiporus biennis]|nr:hypothetical protein C8Q75DRAFT_227853 [Abortiporus biennis]
MVCDSMEVTVVDTRRGMDGFREAVCFQLPALASDIVLDVAGIQVFRSSSCPNSPGITRSVDFEADKSASIIALQMSFYKDPDRDSDDDDDDIQPVHHTFQLFIHTYKMLQLHAYFSSQNMQTVPWDLWGPNNTRITNIFPHTWSVFGTRVVIDQEFIKFLDFNVAPLSSDIQTRNAHGNSGLISESGYRVNGIFLDDNLTSSLPFHLTLTQVRYDFVVGEAVMLNADTILIYNRPTSDLHRDESVFTLEY